MAGRLLLTDFETGHRKQAEDLARCQAWHVVLVAATARTAPGVAVSPLTGQPLRVETSPSAVRVAGVLAAHDELQLTIRTVSPPARVAGKPEEH